MRYTLMMIRSFAISVAFCVSIFGTMSFAQNNSEAIEPQTTSYVFTKKRYTIDGEASITESEGLTVLNFSEAFRTKGGPDLKVYLSKKSLDELANESVIDNSVKIGVLKSKKGAQSYIVPEDISLSDYKSVLIHCEAFTVLWGGFDL